MTREEEDALVTAFLGPPYRETGPWTFEYEYPGYFVYWHDQGRYRVYFTPDFEEDGVVSIQIEREAGGDREAYEHAYTAPLRADELFAIVQPHLARLAPGRWGRKHWDPRMDGREAVPVLFHGTLRKHLPEILEEGIERGEGWGGAGTSGAFLSGTPEGALYWAKFAYQRETGERIETAHFDAHHAHEIDDLLTVLAVQIPADQAHKLYADEEQFEDVHADFPRTDWKKSLEVIGDVRFDGEIPPEWVVEVIEPSRI